MKKIFQYSLICLLFLAGSAISEANNKAPEINVRDTSGKLWKLDKLKKDKVYLVEFWATWCATCKKIEPIVKDFVNSNRGKDFEFLSVSIDTDKSELVKYIKAKKPKYPVLLDPTYAMAKRWDAMQVPRMFMVKNGKISWENTGTVTRKALDKALDQAKQN